MQSRDLVRGIYLLFLLLLVFPPAGATAADDRVDAGNTEWNKGNYTGALEAYEKAIALDPANVAAWTNKCGALNNLGRFTEGLAACEKALGLDPKFANAWNSKGVACKGLLRFDEALAAYERTIALDPKNAIAWSNKAGVLIDLKRYDEGLAACEKAISLDPDFAGAWNNKGIALSSMKRYDEGLAACERATALDPAFASAWITRGWTLNELKRFDDGLAACERAIALDPNLPWAWNNKGVSLQHLGRLEESLAALDQAVTLDPTLALIWSNRGDTLQKMGRSDEALESYRKARALDASVPAGTANIPGTDPGFTGYLVFAIFAAALAGIVLFFRQRTSRPARVTGEAAVEHSMPIARIPPVQVSGRTPLSAGTGHEVFISHAREDTAIAETVCQALEHRGIRCWTPSRDLTPGAMEGEAIMAAIATSRMMVVVLSAAATRSGFVVRDLNAAVSRRMGILPLITEDVLLPDSLDYLIGGIPGVRLAPLPAENDLANLADVVRTRLDEWTGAGNRANDRYPH